MQRLCLRLAGRSCTLSLFSLLWMAYTLAVYVYWPSVKDAKHQRSLRDRAAGKPRLPDVAVLSRYRKENLNPPVALSNRSAVRISDQERSKSKNDDGKMPEQGEVLKNIVQHGGQLRGRQEQRVADQAEEDDVVYPTYVERGPADGPGNFRQDEAWKGAGGGGGE